MRRLTALVALALFLSACGDCDCCKKKPAPGGPEPVASASAEGTASVAGSPENGRGRIGNSSTYAEDGKPGDGSPAPKGSEGGGVGYSGGGSWEAPAAAPTPPAVAVAWRGEGATLELSVWHMRCAGCEKKVEDALKGLAGVKDVVATNADSKVVVTLSDATGREAAKPLIRETLEDLDFRVLGE